MTEEPKSLKKLVEAAEEERKTKEQIEEENNRRLAEELEEAKECYLKLKSEPITGILIDKAPLIEKIFPTLIIHGEPPYYEDAPKLVHKTHYNSNGGSYILVHENPSKDPTLVPPRLVLSVVLPGYDYPPLRGNLGIRTIKYLGFCLTESGLVNINHFYRVPRMKRAGRWGNPYDFYWKSEDWSPGGIPIEKFGQELDPLLAKFCEMYKDPALTTNEQPGYKFSNLTFTSSSDSSLYNGGRVGKLRDIRGRFSGYAYNYRFHQILYPESKTE